ncbi:adenylate cyclase [Serinibacter salmoneus]|uniref:Adenylate cyclase n=1 Tax=Serinibacter salmoneus TaxID=556530 RepID=A0A2A9D222_9MICO|nr:adenylate cyclase [Serinibacter salmoneus]
MPRRSPAPPAPTDHASPTLARQARALLGDLPTMDAYDVAREIGTTAARVLQFWRGLGFPGVPASQRVFTPADAEALRRSLRLVEEAGLSEGAWRTLVRAAAHSADRLALWQMETLVRDAERRWSLDDVSARLVVLDTIGESIGDLDALAAHAWRRHLLALLTRTERAVGEAGLTPETDDLPLERAVAFVDVTSYTQRTAHLGASALADLVEAFEERARDVVTDAGARVVKTMGDGVLVVADDLATGVDVALRLSAAYADSPVDLEVHGAVTWGRVLSRSGDIFGPTVNLASRLADIAEARQILTDEVTWAVLQAETSAGTAGSPPAQAAAVGVSPGVAGTTLPEREVPGIGAVVPVLLERLATRTP